MRRRDLVAFIPAVLVSRGAGAAAAPAAVVASFSILADMTARIGGDAVAVRSLVPVDGDAHVWEPRPADLRAVQSAAVLVENGLGLEGWMARLPAAAGFVGRRITASQGVKPRRMVEDGHAVTDPHAWQDPRNGVLYARAIASGLAAALPDQAAAIQDRARAYVAEIEETDRWITQMLGGHRIAQSQAVQQRLVRIHVQLLLLLALHVFRAEGPVRVGQPGRANLGLDHLRRQRNAAHQPAERAARFVLRNILLDVPLHGRNHAAILPTWGQERCPSRR